MDNKRKEKLLKSVNKEKKTYQKMAKKNSDRLKKEDVNKIEDKQMKEKREKKLKSRIEKEKVAYQKSIEEANEEKIKEQLRSVSQGFENTIINSNQEDGGIYDSTKENRKTLMLSAGAIAVLLLVIVIAIAVNSSKPKSVAEQKKTETTTEEQTTEAFSVTENNPLILCEEEAVSNLITSYITAMRDVDVETMKSLDLYDASYDNTSNLKNTASVVEDYKDITIYTKKGPYVNGFMVYVVTNIKFKDIEKTCQGMFQYVVRKESDGNYVLDTTPVDDIESDEVSNNLIAISQSEDVLTLIDGVNQQCQEDIEADQKLKEYVQGKLQNTIPASE